MLPFIFIDPKDEIWIVCRNLYYKPQGYYTSAKKLLDVCKKAGHNFLLDDVKKWLDRQVIYQIHRPRPKFIPCVGFGNITIPMEVIQADILYTPYDKIGGITYLFCLTVVDVASQYKGAVPIGTTLDIINMDVDEISMKNILNSSIVANAFEKLFNDPNNEFSWNKLKLVITDKGPEFKKDFEKLLISRGKKFQKAVSKNTTGIVENFNKILSRKLFIIQDAHELLLPLPLRSRIWVKNLSNVINILNNTVTRLIGMTPNEAIKKKRVYAKPSKPRKGPMGFDEEQLAYNSLVRYLLKPGELEGGRRRATDCNWSPQTYCIKNALVQKNQPILYWLIDENGNCLERSFVREELLVIPHNSELPPDWVLQN